MAFDRDSTLKKAEKLLRQGRLDGAIAEYVRVLEDQPRDWTTANTLGDLYARNGQPAEAVGHYSRIAGHFMEEGFYPKAAALYKKILKIDPDSEAVQLQLAEVSARQGLLADAKAYLSLVESRRRKRGDRRGAAEIIVRLGTLDSGDFEARQLAARTLEDMGQASGAADAYKAMSDDLAEKGRTADALAALREYARLAPGDPAARATLARAALERGDLDGARKHLDRETAGSDPALLLALVELDLRAGAINRARELLPGLLASSADSRARVVELGWTLLDGNAEAALICVDAAVDAALAASDHLAAVRLLQEFVARVPGHIPALLKLVEICVDAGLESSMYEAQERLADAYLAAGHAAEARAIAEDLVAREPWESAHIDRFRRSLVMLRVSDPDTVIAERLSGQVPFMARDPFFELPVPAAESAGADDRPAPVAIAVDESAGEEALPAPQEPATAAPAVRPEAVAAARATATSGEELDITGALGELDARPAASTTGPSRNLEEVFQQKRDQAESGPDYSTQHMILARTYLEMGRPDEAIASLTTAARSTRHRFEAASVLGRLLRDRGERTGAIDWLERAAEAPPPEPEQGHALLYDLGVLLDDEGEVVRALAVFLELQAEAGDYRDVPSRIDRLARAQSGG
ncbi:MAG TPA: tetratricopeptide repeat protein [Vicinamibacterales bacterium]|nr:tetratricopeptide repeat protein [Vicinamibacterales bacterium]